MKFAAWFVMGLPLAGCQRAAVADGEANRQIATASAIAPPTSSSSVRAAVSASAGAPTATAAPASRAQRATALDLPACALPDAAEPAAISLQLAPIAPRMLDLGSEASGANPDELASQLAAHAAHPIVSLEQSAVFPALREDGKEVAVLDTRASGFKAFYSEQTLNFYSVESGAGLASYRVGVLELDGGVSEVGWRTKQLANVAAANRRLAGKGWIHLESAERLRSCAPGAAYAGWHSLDVSREGDGAGPQSVRLWGQGLDLELAKPDEGNGTSITIRSQQLDGTQAMAAVPIRFGPITRNGCGGFGQSTPEPQWAKGLWAAFGSRKRGFVFLVPHVQLGGDCESRRPEYELLRMVKLPAQLRK